MHYSFDDTPNNLTAQLFPGMVISNTFNEKWYGDVTVSEVASIDEATTFQVNIEGYPPIVGERIPVRVVGIDTPEIKGKCESEKVLARSLSDLVDRHERKPFLGQFFDYLRRIARLFNENNRKNEQKWLFRSRFILSPTGS